MRIFVHNKNIKEMNNQTWIPEPNECVLFGQDLWRVLKVDMGGKCTIRKFKRGTGREGRLTEVDVTELKKPLQRKRMF